MEPSLNAVDTRSLERTVRHYERLIRRQRAGLEDYELYVLYLREWVRRQAVRRAAVAPPVATSMVGLVAASVFRVARPSA